MFVICVQKKWLFWDGISSRVLRYTPTMWPFGLLLFVSLFFLKLILWGKIRVVFSLNIVTKRLDIYIAWHASSDLGLFGCNRKLGLNTAAMSSAICLCIICLVGAEVSSIPWSFPIRLSYSLPWSCSQAWQSFTHVSAEFKVMSDHPGDIGGRFLLHTHISFVYCWCLKLVWGNCCGVSPMRWWRDFEGQVDHCYDVNKDAF